MTTANQAYRFNGVPVKVRMPASGETVNGEAFSVPDWARVCTVYVPALVGTGASIKLQGLVPNDVVEATQTWVDLKLTMLTDITFVALDAFVESTACTIPTSAMGGGVLRWVATEDQSSVPSDVIMLFTK